MDLGAVVFYGVAAATIVASLGVVVTRSIVYSALLLILSLGLTALVYLILLSDFLALVQILVYGGTVSILLLFALMLTRPRETQAITHKSWPLAALGSVLLLGVLAFGALGTTWPATASDLPLGPRPTATVSATTATTAGRTTTTTTAASVRPGEPVRLGPAEIGSSLFTTWAVPFEIASVVLLVALIGSLLIARATEDVDEAQSRAGAGGGTDALGNALGTPITRVGGAGGVGGAAGTSRELM
jgi:NADH:ubiquinone oxidoreductase subunit 6 (subunit J)